MSLITAPPPPLVSAYTSDSVLFYQFSVLALLSLVLIEQSKNTLAENLSVVAYGC